MTPTTCHYMWQMGTATIHRIWQLSWNQAQVNIFQGLEAENNENTGGQKIQMAWMDCGSNGVTCICFFFIFLFFRGGYFLLSFFCFDLFFVLNHFCIITTMAVSDLVLQGTKEGHHGIDQVLVEYSDLSTSRDITMTSQWAWWRLKSSATRLFTQSFIQVQIKDNIKAPRHWPLWGEFTGDRWIPHTKNQ